MHLRIFFFCAISVLFFEGHCQTNYPWERPLKMAWSTDGTTFDKFTIFQDSSGVPSVIKWKGDTLVCVFQWFRLPKNSATWDKVAVKFSYDAGVTWTKPTPISVNGIPGSYQRPFDPTLTVVSKTSLRIYFSSSSTMPIGGLDGSVNTYSAISSNGISYTFEPDPRFDQPSKPVIDPAIIYFNNSWHYAAPAGPPQDGAYHATGNDGLNFTQEGMYASDMRHNWTGNFMLNSPTELRFYGSGQLVWYNTSTDGTTWQGYANTNIKGGDPSIVKVANGNYLTVYVGENYVTGVNNLNFISEMIIYPNPSQDQVVVDGVTGSFQYRIYSPTGAMVLSGTKNKLEIISTSSLRAGLYFLCVVTADGQNKSVKIVKE
jgi:hypothetical protein